MKAFEQLLPTRIIFGAGEIDRLATLELPGKKALLVISSGNSMRKYGYVDKVVKGLAENGVETVIYDKIQANPIKEHVMEAAAICRREQCDFIVGLGGGSSIDSAKSIAVMACNEGDYWDYVSGGTGKGQTPKHKALPVIAIPTTAGTGTEVDPWTVITHNNEKIGYGTPDTMPQVAIVDPALMVSVPPKLTAYQGFDAFFHAAEGYLATIATPVSEIFSLKSIELIGRSLAKAVKNGNDLEARSEVALASTLAGLVESTSSCISEHSLAHAVSALFPNVEHGAALTCISLAWFASFVDVVPERYMRMAEALTGQKSTSPADFFAALADLQAACGIDNIALSEYGVTEEDLSRLVRNARETMGGLFGMDPRPLSDDEVLEIYRKSYK
ncbi:iron-containing alcohol dehydrogenase [Bacteroides sp. GD17]|uniref:iron-containing alcohol dehydrogenase n=1 Tax=Bacteroides sp. GD17 TaxID=3139826 RepID=UPI0025F7F88E|nr:iron-containing alcohol dehydrogenase [uncultured Bacteroides sp.]